MKVLNYGSLNYDYLYTVDHIVAEGETESSKRLSIHTGGKGLNQSIALAKAGVLVYHGGMVGSDGNELLDICEKYGVDITNIKMVSDKSGHAIIQVDAEAHNCILLYGGANRQQTKEHIDQVLGGFSKGDILLLQNEVNELKYILDMAHSIGMTIILNPSPYDEAIDACDLNKVDIFILNEIEGQMMTGYNEPEEILAKLQRKYPKAKVVLTLGKNGAIYQDGNQRVSQSIFKTDPVDTTAAGDTFTGYFIAGYIEGLAVSDNLKRSAMASSITVSRWGAAGSIPTKEELEAFRF
ncbi:MAG: ribokinase [Lachnospiraceae bacterium]|nr:ribokinase [Lachnospiraceae bacterium]